MLAIATTPIVHRHKRGRPRKVNVRRSAKGKSLGEVIDLSAMFEQPHRRGFKNPSSQRLGYALGRLAERGLISEQQIRAGSRWASVVAAYRRQLLSAPPLSTRSGEMAERVSSGFQPWETEIVHEVDPEQAARDRANLKHRYDTCFEALGLLGYELRRGHAILNAVRKVCIDDRDPCPDEIGDLRLGLNSLHRQLFSKEDER